MRKLKIVHCVESYHPSIGGMQEVVKQLSERLVKLGHSVTVLTRHHAERQSAILNGVKIIGFKITDNPLYAETDEEKRYVQYLLDMEADVVTFFAAQQWATNLALSVLKKIKAAKVSVPTGYSGLYWPEFKTYFQDMRTYIHDYDMNVYLSDDYRDINFARENNVSKIMIIPNAAAEDEFLPASAIDVRKQLGLKKDAFLVLLVGSYTGWKGHHEALEIFLRSKLSNAVLLMIGNNYKKFKIGIRSHTRLYFLNFFNKLLGRKKVVFNHFSREFTVAAYKQADLFLFPSNIECSPIVLFECAAARLPFLATDVGNTVEISQWTKGGEILPTTKDKDGFSHAVIEGSVMAVDAFYQNTAEWKRRMEITHEIWKEKFSWEKITLHYEKLYYQLSEKK